MVCRMNRVPLHAIDSVPIIAFLHRLALEHLLQVRVLIPFIVNGAPLASPATYQSLSRHIVVRGSKVSIKIN